MTFHFNKFQQIHCLLYNVSLALTLVTYLFEIEESMNVSIVSCAVTCAFSESKDDTEHDEEIDDMEMDDAETDTESDSDTEITEA